MKTIEQINNYKGWKIYRRTGTYINRYGKICTGRSYFAVNNQTEWFVGGLKDVKSFIDAGIDPHKDKAYISTVLNPTSSLYC